MKKKQDVIWVGEFGFDGNGASTLGIQFHKILNIPVLYKKGNVPISPGITLWETIDELKQKIEEINPKVILLLPDIKNKKDNKKTRDFLETIFSFQKTGTKIIFIDCTRNGNLFRTRETKETLEEFKKMCPYQFDEFWALTDSSKETWEDFYNKHKIIDFNLYNIEKQEILNRNKNIGYISRISGFKGVPRLFKQVEKRYANNSNKLNLPYIHIGSNHEVKRWEEKGIVSGNFSVVQFFAHSIKDKRPRDVFSIKKSLDEDIDPNKYNIYPTYDYEDLKSIIPKIGIAICPTLARTEPFKQNSNKLFQTKPKDKDSNYIEKNKNKWTVAMEYINYELIDYGVPVLFSKDYALTYDPDMIKEFPELIYDNLEDCLDYVEKNYDMLLTIAPKQKQWLIQKTENIKNNLINELNKII